MSDKQKGAARSPAVWGSASTWEVGKYVPPLGSYQLFFGMYGLILEFFLFVSSVWLQKRLRPSLPNPHLSDPGMMPITDLEAIASSGVKYVNDSKVSKRIAVRGHSS